MRTLLGVCLALVLSVPAFAQESTVLTQMPRAERDGATATASVDIPITILQTRDALLFVPDIPDDVYENPTTRIKIAFYVLNPTKRSWELRAYGVFVGIPGGYTDPETGEHNPMPIMEQSIKAYAGQTIRAELETSTRVSIGLSILDFRYPVLGGSER